MLPAELRATTQNDETARGLIRSHFTVFFPCAAKQELGNLSPECRQIAGTGNVMVVKLFERTQGLCNASNKLRGIHQLAEDTHTCRAVSSIDPSGLPAPCRYASVRALSRLKIVY